MPSPLATAILPGTLLRGRVERANNASWVLLALNLSQSAVGITKGEFLEETAFGVGRPLVGPKWPKMAQNGPKMAEGGGVGAKGFAVSPREQPTHYPGWV